MNAPVKIAAFAATLAAVFGISLGIGNAVGPVGDELRHDAAHSAGHAPASHVGMPESGEPAEPNSAMPALPAGLAVSEDGYSLQLAAAQSTAGPGRLIKFTILGPDGAPVTRFDMAHEKRLHFIAVRRDFSDFQHVHPTMDSAGRWTVPVDLAAGSWRVFTDFVPSGAEPLTLGADLAVPGRFRPASRSSESRTATVDGYQVMLSGDLAAGTDAKLTLTVSKDGRPVTDLQPYLGAYGHLVALREGDLAYLHVHPEGTPGDGRTSPGPDVVFYAEVPTAGNYRLYLDFRHQGVVRTAAFTVAASQSPATATPAPESMSSDSGQDGH